LIIAATYKTADPMQAFHLLLLQDFALHIHNFMTSVTSAHAH